MPGVQFFDFYSASPIFRKKNRTTAGTVLFFTDVSNESSEGAYPALRFFQSVVVAAVTRARAAASAVTRARAAASAVLQLTGARREKVIQRELDSGEEIAGAVG